MSLRKENGSIHTFCPFKITHIGSLNTSWTSLNGSSLTSILPSICSSLTHILRPSIPFNPSGHSSPLKDRPPPQIYPLEGNHNVPSPLNTNTHATHPNRLTSCLVPFSVCGGWGAATGVRLGGTLSREGRRYQKKVNECRKGDRERGRK